MAQSNHDDENFMKVSCINCGKTLLEVSCNTTGIIRKKCDRCKTMRVIPLPLRLKNNNLHSVGTSVPA